MNVAQLLNAIRAAIKADSRSPGAIAREAGMARSQLSRLLSGERGLSVDVLEKLAGVLGFEILIRPKSKKKER